jgi:hypothetical protein
MEVTGQLHGPAALPPGKEPLLHIGQEAGWAPQPVWTPWWGEKLLAPTETRIPDHPARSPALYHRAITAPEKITVDHLIQKFALFYRTRRYITVFTRTRHWNLSWARWIQSTHSHPMSLRSIIILLSHLRLGLPGGLCPQIFQPKLCKHFWYLYAGKTMRGIMSMK